MIIPEPYRSYVSSHSKWLPAIDWNVKLFGAHMQKVENGWSVPEEAHPAFELILILEGTQITLLENLKYELHQGDILLIPPGFKHINQCTDEDGLTYFIAHFNVDEPLFRQEMSLNAKLFYPCGSEDNERLKAGMMNWVHLAQREGEYTVADLFRIQAGLFEIFSVLAQRMSANSEETVPPTAAHYARLIAESLKSNFNHENMKNEVLREREIHIEDIAASLKISPGYALEVFQKVYGISPRKYLSELKLHEAKQLIHQPDLDISQIASMLGYSSLAHFSRQFKRWTGMSPRQYRQKLGSIVFFDQGSNS
ncbi:helix-turn-helix domain-containing protein [Paenibacillus lutimineralis]|uniref:AraC family transcriptional regulator n=1 Tax=Paenibacillus lutimineralis TaxID=2707005 RepID=A0A3Q9I7B8_9BACL|nr:AraC family transcriptional regulator [Paenibacillus lutimineralis]AZS14121.1 AraC family transcriptional regulator [Paenibacillus lutimineralis]